ncbi:MAG TPA: UPF0280 family protein [Candidatus Bathyarchaeia archaeon]
MSALFKQVFQFKETNCFILSDKKNAIDKATASLKHNRSELDRYVRTHEKFLYSLQPVSAEDGPLVARLMDEASRKANVGPMAAVAGVLADLAVKDMIAAGCEVAVVENGGEVSAISNRRIDIALLAGDSPLSRQIGFRLEEFPIGIATSSSLFSQALSFGEAEAVTVFAENAGLADAASTAAGNLVKGDDCQAAIERGIDEALSIKGVRGVLIMYKGFVGKAGKVPKIIKVREEEGFRPFSEAQTIS